MNYIFFKTSFATKFALTLVCTLFFIACQSDETALQNDAEAKLTISKTSKLLTSGKKLKAEQIQAIKSVFEKYPKSESALQTYKSSLIIRGDWGSLEKVLKQIPKEMMSDEDKSNLGKTYIKLGRYKNAIEILKPFENGNNLENKAFLANAYFKLGDYENAKTILDKNWDDIIKEKKVNEIATRGMIYFHEKDSEKAITTLEKGLELDSDNITVANALSRVYSAKGNIKKAEEYLALVQKSFDRMTAEETRKTNLVGKLYKLQEAYKAKRFQEVINLANETLPEADRRNKPALMQYLFNSYKALGKTKEAQEIMAKAKQMQQQK